MKQILSYTIVVMVSTIVLTSAAFSITTCLKTNSNIYLISKLVEVVRDENAHPAQRQVMAAAEKETGDENNVYAPNPVSLLKPMSNTCSFSTTSCTSSSVILPPDTVNSDTNTEETQPQGVARAPSYLTSHSSTQ